MNKENNSIDATATAAESGRMESQIQKLSAMIVGTTSEDLTGLAAIHTAFQEISHRVASETGLPRAAAFQEASDLGVRIVEQIILGEVADLDASMRSLSETIASLQTILSDALETNAGTTPAAKSAAPKTARPAPPAAVSHPPIGDEDPINSEDLPLALEFIGEASGHIESAETNLLKLEDEPNNAEAVNAVFRGFHTIKGVAGFLNLKQIGALSHAAESLLDLARRGELEISGANADVVLESIDLLKSLFAGLDNAAKTGGKIESNPKLADLLTRLHAAAEGQLAIARATPVAASQDHPAAATAVATPLSPAVEPTKSANPTAEISSAAGHQGEVSVKVATERLDSLINMVGELVIAQLMVSQDVVPMAVGNQRVLRNMTHLGKITRELQDLSMSMRMVPISGAFQKMGRLVRDLCRKAGKEIDLEIEGGDTELDRNVVEAIGDPLVHMVRNAADHGVELPARRLEAGKPRTGKIKLRAFHQGGTIVIEISDDGRGLCKEKILHKAIDAGIVAASDSPSDAQIFELIFHAGLSTAEKVTDISGRGVGMDVVRKNVEALRGRIEIQSVEGKGTTFIIRLPLTLAVIDGLIVSVGTEKYIVPITSIEQSIRPKPEQISTVQGRGEICNVRGRLMPLTRLHRLFDVKPRTENPAEALVVIVHDDKQHCCLLVDELLGQQQVVIKSLGESIGAVPGVSGGAILGDGSVSLILDVPGLIGLATAG